MIGIVLIILTIYFLLGIRVVPQSKKYIIERLGKYFCTWDSGLHFKIQGLDRIANVVSLKEQVFDFPPQPMITHDNVIVSIDFVVFCKVFDPKLYSYGIENPIMGMQNISATTLRNRVGEMELDQLLISRESVNKTLEKVLDEATDPWGIKVNRVEIKQVILSEELAEEMSRQMKAERERRQTVLEAKAHQEAVVSRAEGDKQAKILHAEADKAAKIAMAEAKAKSMAIIYQAEADGLALLNQVGVSPSILRLKSIESLKNISNGQATKIFMPNDALSNIGILAEALNTKDK